jgi:peptide/nickel transport system ATP-binding protein
MAERLLEVDDLQVSFLTEDGIVRAVDGVSFTLDRGEVLAIVGESGSGKSVTVMTLMGLTRTPNSRLAGSARFRGRELVTASDRELELVRGAEIAIVFQDPISSLSPVKRIGDQIVEQIRAHEKIGKTAALERAVELMERVGIPHAGERARAFPHEFSGGMRQRAMIAMALSLSPSVLIADEPTTALDVTIQAQILRELKQLSQEGDSGVIFVTHDLGVVADIADRVIVMYAGRVLEAGTLDEIFYDPQHPYTWGLLGSVTRIDREPPQATPGDPRPAALAARPAAGLPLPSALPTRIRALPRGARPRSAPTGSAGPRRSLLARSRRQAPAPRRRRSNRTDPRKGGGMSAAPASRLREAEWSLTGTAQPLLEVEHLQLYFPVKAGVLVDRTIGHVHAVDDVSLALREGETLGLVGESGCGKSTLARCIVRLLEPTGGTLRYRGRDITHLGRRALQPVRREVQLVFQDPVSSLNPRKRVGQIVGAPMRLHGVRNAEPRVRELLGRVGLNPEHVNRFPHEFSGGQRQRIGVARALAVNPRLIVLDEPVSALDVSIQAQVVNLLDDLQDDFGLTYIFIAHDLGVIRHVSDRIAVMYLGKVMELSPARELYEKPIHPYTEALLSAIPIPDPKENRARERLVVGGEPPSPTTPPPGCRFHTRCPRATDVCRTVEPPLVEYPGGHLAACHHPLNVDESEIAGARRSPLSPQSAGRLVPGAEEAP